MIPPSPDRQALRQLADRQDGAVTREQAMAYGVSPRMTRWLIREQHWRRLAPGVFLTADLDPSWRALAWAGVLLGGDRARLGGQAAGHLYGLITDPPLPVVVMIPHDARIRSEYPWAFVREREGTHDGGSRGNPPRLSPEDTVLDLCNQGRPGDVVGWVTAAVQRRLTTPRRLALALNRRRRQCHRTLILELISDVAEGAQSPLEIRYLRDVERSHGLPRGRRQHRSRDGRSVRDVDYEELKVVVELDGRAGHEELGPTGRLRASAPRLDRVGDPMRQVPLGLVTTMGSFWYLWGTAHSPLT